MESDITLLCQKTQNAIGWGWEKMHFNVTEVDTPEDLSIQTFIIFAELRVLVVRRRKA